MPVVPARPQLTGQCGLVHSRSSHSQFILGKQWGFPAPEHVCCSAQSQTCCGRIRGTVGRLRSLLWGVPRAASAHTGWERCPDSDSVRSETGLGRSREASWPRLRGAGVAGCSEVTPTLQARRWTGGGVPGLRQTCARCVQWGSHGCPPGAMAGAPGHQAHAQRSRGAFL